MRPRRRIIMLLMGASFVVNVNETTLNIFKPL